MQTMSKILITGSTDGIGKLAAISLAQKGHKVIIHGRNEEKLTKCLQEIQQNSNLKEVDGFLADFLVPEKINLLGKSIAESYSNLDVIINNAGVYHSSNEKAQNGINLRFMVNYYAPYILTKHLLALLSNSSDARIINVSSAAQSPVSLRALRGEESLPENQAYAESKLALIMWTNYLAQQESGYTVLSVNPGSLLDTKMANEAFGQSWSPAEKGSSILEQLATSSKIKNCSGAYFDNDKGQFSEAHEDAYNPQKVYALIQTTEEVICNW